MKKFIMLSLMVLTLGMVGMVHGGTLYLSMSDTMPSPGWYALDGTWIFMHTFPSPVQDLEFDKVTGDLLALTTTGVFRLDQGGTHTQITGVPGAPLNQGGDIAVSSTGDFAVSLTDATNIVDIYASDGTPVATVTFSSASAVADIEYDKATDDLYALTDTGVWKRDTGSPPAITQIVGVPPAPLNAGGDIAISSAGDLAVSLQDTMTFIGLYNISGAYWDAANLTSPVQDIDYDMNTGDLYAYTDAGIKKFVDNGVPYDMIGTVTTITTAAYANAGGDLSWAPDWECAEAADCFDDDACTVDDCECVDNLCDCGEPADLDCDDLNDCTDDTCDAVSGCEYACNATDYTDACCADDACSEELICEAPTPCSAPADASVHKSNEVYGASGLSRHLVYFLFPVGAVILLRIRRRKK